MGRQVTVNLVDLLKAGCELKPHIRPIEIDELTQYVHNPSFLEVIHPSTGGFHIYSDCLDYLSFDCRDKTTSGNGWIEYWLIAMNIPYTAG